jgi:hypothetical protein
MKKVLIVGMILAVSGVVVASDEDDLTSLSYISYLERYATVLPANSEETIEAVINMPLVAGDRVDTAREGRMEVVLADGNTMWLDEYTTLSLDAVAFSRDAESERTVIFLADGSLIVEVSEHGLTPKPTRIDSRAATVYLDEYGLYRLQALPSGGLRVEVLSGLAEAATTTGGVLVRAESAAEVGGGEVQRSEGQLTLSDDFAVWVDARRQIAAGESANYVDLRYSRQAAQLDNYGSWVYADSINAWAWQPTVGGSWQPYQAGRWYWTPTGYAWISYEPWGWLPYHYGSWNFDVGFGWVWSYGNYWGPAWVSWIRWPGYVGWCPYGYYNNWYWNSYPGHRPDYPGGGGGGAYQPPRRDVMPPPRTASHRVGPDASTSRLASDPAVDLSGRVRLAEVDRRGWTVVADDDFASPNLARLARSGDRVMPTAGDQTGVVMTGPLTTRSPSVASPRSEIERVFRGVEVRATADVSPLLARDNSLDPAVARQLAQPTTVGEIGQRSRDAAASNRQTVASGLALGAGSPFRAPSQSRAAQPNLYRPTMYGSSPPTSTRSGSSSGSRQLIAPRTFSGRSSASRPVVVPPSGSSVSSRPSSSTGSSRSTTRSPSGRSSSSVGSSSGRTSAPRPSSTGSSRSSGGTSRSSAGTSRPSGRTSSSSSSSSSGTKKQ